MGAIGSYVPAGVFDPEDVKAMSLAYEEVCTSLRINGDAGAREIIAVRVIELARRGQLCPTVLRNRILAEANAGTDDNCDVVYIWAGRRPRRMNSRMAAAPSGSTHRTLA